MDTSDVYPDPFGDALSYSSQRLAQLASLITAAAMVQARRRTQRNDPSCKVPVAQRQKQN